MQINRTILVDLLPSSLLSVDDVDKVIGNWQPPVGNLSYRTAMIRADNILLLLAEELEPYILVIQMPEYWQSFGIVMRVLHLCKAVEKRLLVLRANGEIVNMGDFLEEKEVMSAPISEQTVKEQGEQTPTQNTVKKAV